MVSSVDHLGHPYINIVIFFFPFCFAENTTAPGPIFDDEDEDSPLAFEDAATAGDPLPHAFGVAYARLEKRLTFVEASFP